MFIVLCQLMKKIKENGWRGVVYIHEPSNPTCNPFNPPPSRKKYQNRYNKMECSFSFFLHDMRTNQPVSPVRYYLLRHKGSIGVKGNLLCHALPREERGKLLSANKWSKCRVVEYQCSRAKGEGAGGRHLNPECSKALLGARFQNCRRPFFQMHPRISIWGCVRPSVRWMVRPSVTCFLMPKMDSILHESHRGCPTLTLLNV